MITLDTPVAAVLGGSKKADKVAKLGLATVGDLLDHVPRRYLETGSLTEVGRLEVGQQLTVVGEIVSNQLKTHTDRRSGRTAYRVDVTLRTDGPFLRMSFFAKSQHTAGWFQHRLRTDREGVFSGKVGQFRDQWQLTNPEIVLFDEPSADGAPDAARLTVQRLKGLFPLYPATKGLESWDLQRALDFTFTVLDDIPDLLPPDLREQWSLIDRRTAYEWIHAPADYAQVGAARKRFRFEEALVTQLVLARRREEVRRLGARPRPGRDDGLLAAFDARLPFTLTDGQRAVGAEIDVDLGRDHPMNRLLQGEVGSGKTLVAVRAMLRVVDSDGQAVLLAPTEVLAQQHHRSITAMLGDLAGGGMLGGAEQSTRLALLTGSVTARQRRETLLRIASGEAGIVIGTHALLEDKVTFADLGLVVVDEQHRFGVEQRSALTGKARTPPHVLVMTATPIPRTVAMTVFGDLETSVLRELPAGRAPIQTTVVPAVNAAWMDRVWQRVREEVVAGHQAYVVCPRIGGEAGDVGEEGGSDPVDYDEDDEPLTADPRSPIAVVDLLAELTEPGGDLAALRVAPLHGRLPADDKDATMRAFAAGELDCLVSTTVIEVGVDVANATVMVLMDADRFGVSQLHQLRGRVGRGGLPGLCLLVTRAPEGSPARERLSAVAATTDGFELARVDLETRREGDVLGASQSGYRSSLRQLRVLRDEATILEARAAADRLLGVDPELAGADRLRRAVDALEDSRKSDFMERA